MLLGHSQDGKIIYGGLGRVEELCGVPRAVLKRLWQKSAETRAHGRVVTADWVSRKKNNHAPQIYDPLEVTTKMKQVKRSKRKTIRALALSLGVSKSSVGKWKLQQDSVIRRHTSPLKPHLTDDHKLARVLYAMDEIDENPQVSVDGESLLYNYKNMMDRIHVDEKWFFITRDHEGYYLAVDEDEPVRKVHSKLHTIT